MKAVRCPSCGAKMKRNGKTSAGAQRWRCGSCGASATLSYDGTAARLGEFLAWLTSKDTQLSMPGQGRTFRRRTAGFWRVWPMPEPTGEVHRVLFVDGTWLARDLVVLIAYDGEHVVSWYMARAETSRAWEALMAPIPAPDVVVCDGGTGFEGARRRSWPRTRVQRCLFHAFCQVKRCTTTRPRLQAGREPCALSVELMHLDALRQADWWAERYLQWCEFWADFLEERSMQDGRLVYTHERLRRARSSLSRLVSRGALFTYLGPGPDRGGAAAANQRPDRGRGQRPAQGRPAQPPGPVVNAQGQGGLPVVLPAHGAAEARARGHCGHADRRRHRPALQDLLGGAQARRRRAGVGRPGRVGGAPPQGPVPLLAGLGQVFYRDTHFVL